MQEKFKICWTFTDPELTTLSQDRKLYRVVVVVVVVVSILITNIAMIVRGWKHSIIIG